MIPKTLHYCWFGGGAKPDLVVHCLRSWTEACPDYTVVEWNETNFDMRSSPPAARAHKAGKFAFVADVVRARVLHEHGGIYVDADVEIHRPLDRFLKHDAFTGFERKGLAFTALWGSVAGHSLSKKILDYYERCPNEDKFSTPNTIFITKIMSDEFGVDTERDELQCCNDGLVVYPSNFFCVNLPEHYATHHFAGSWLAQNDPKNWSHVVLADFYAAALRDIIRRDTDLNARGSNARRMSSRDKDHLRRHISHILADRVFSSNRERLRWHAAQIVEVLAAKVRREFGWVKPG